MSETAVLQAVLDAIAGTIDTSAQISDHPNVKFAMMKRLDAQKEAFFAAYHAQWIRSENRWMFDPAMTPGDPDHCWQAWLTEQALQ